MFKNHIQRHERLHSMRMVSRDVKFQSRSPRLAMNPHNIHFLLILLALILRPLIILQLPLQTRNDILNTSLTFFKREISTPIPPPRFLVCFQRRPLPQLGELRVAEGIRCGSFCSSRAATRNPIFDARVEFGAEELFEGVCLCPAWVVRAWIGD